MGSSEDRRLESTIFPESSPTLKAASGAYGIGGNLPIKLFGA